jgi:hypothetical protein
LDNFVFAAGWPSELHFYGAASKGAKLDVVGHKLKPVIDAAASSIVPALVGVFQYLDVGVDAHGFTPQSIIHNRLFGQSASFLMTDG